MGAILSEHHQAADDMAQWAVETIPGLLVAELPGQDSRVARLLVQAAELRAERDKLRDLLHEQQRMSGAQDALIVSLREQLRVLKGKPAMPSGWHGFVFETAIDGVPMWALAQTTPSDDYEPRVSRRYTPVYPEVCCLWIGGKWVDITAFDDLGDTLDEDAEEFCKAEFEAAWEGA